MKNRNHPTWIRKNDHRGIPSLFVPAVLGEDLDYCFGNTNEAMRVTELVTAMHTHLTVSEIQAARAEVEERHEPFSTVAFIETELKNAGEGKTWTDHLKPYIIEKAREAEHRKRLLNLGARAVFDVAERYGMYEVVVTHGAVPEPAGEFEQWAATEWQTTKVDATPVINQRPRVVTYTSSKDREYDKWWVEEVGLYALPENTWQRTDEPVYAQAVVQLDDKAKVLKNFKGKQRHMFGIHVLPKNDKDIRQTQLGDLPGHIKKARGLAQAADILTAMVYDDEYLAAYYKAA